MRFAQILSRNFKVLDKLYRHEFNRQLYNGTLPPWQFKHFLKQDELYLRDYSKALWRVSERLPKEEHAQKFRQFSVDINRTERQLHLKYLAKLPSMRFFSSKTVGPVKIPIIAEYTDYLLYSAEKAPIDEAVISLSACYCVYRDMGERINLKQCESHNPYLEWLASYSGEEFVKSTEEIIKIADELIAPVSDFGHRERIIAAFNRSAEYELKFFDDSLAIGERVVSIKSIVR